MRKAQPPVFQCSDCHAITTDLNAGKCYACLEQAEIDEIRAGTFRRLLRTASHLVMGGFPAAKNEARLAWHRFFGTGPFAKDGFYDGLQPGWRTNTITPPPAPRPFMPDPDRIQAQQIEAHTIRTDHLPAPEVPRFPAGERPPLRRPFQPALKPLSGPSGGQGSDRRVPRYDQPSSSPSRAHDDGTGFILGLTTGIPTSPSGIVGAAIHNADQSAAAAPSAPACPTPSHSSHSHTTHDTGSSYTSSDTGSSSSFSCDP